MKVFNLNSVSSYGLEVPAGTLLTPLRQGVAGKIVYAIPPRLRKTGLETIELLAAEVGDAIQSSQRKAARNAENQRYANLNRDY